MLPTTRIIYLDSEDARPRNSAPPPPMAIETAARGANTARRRWSVRLCLLALLILGELVISYRASLRVPHDAGDAWGMVRAGASELARASGTIETPSEATPAPAPAPPAAALSPGVATAAPPDVTEPSPSVAKPAIPSDMGLLRTIEAPIGHRIYVEGRSVGQTPESVLVACGKARVKIGSAGQARVIDIPCGNEISVSH